MTPGGRVGTDGNELRPADWPLRLVPHLSGLSGIAVALLGATSLLGWFLDVRILSALRADWIPMAPNTALCFLALGTGLACFAWSVWWGPDIVRAVCGAVLVVAVARLVEYFGGLDLGVDRWFLSFPAERLGLAPVGRMAFFTALDFTLASGALLLLSLAKDRGQGRGAAKALAVAVGGSGVAFSLGYLYGSPLLYGEETIPMALNTALGFVAIGPGLFLCASLPSLLERRAAHATLLQQREILEGQVRARTEQLDQVKRELVRKSVVHREAENALQRSEDALQVSERRFELLVDSIRDYAILMLDPDGRVRSWNEGASRIYGWPEGEMLGESLSRLYSEEDARSGLPARELQVAGNGERYLEERWQVRRDGTRFWAGTLVAAMRDAGGEFRGYARITRDLTERKRAEDDARALNAELEERVRRRTAQLELANRELEAFSYSVSHDLRAPLRSIAGFSQALLEDHADQLDAEGRDHLGRVCRATERMGDLIDDLLQLSRISRRELQRERVDIGEIARRLMEGLREAEPARQVELSLEPGLTAKADPGLLEIVLENLLGNAWKFTSGRGSAWLEVGSLRTEEDERAFFVRDDGAGFDMAYADKLFAPFQRLHGATEFPGTGVGLATVQRIVHRHGGRVWAEGAVDGGATFYFTLGPGAEGEPPVTAASARTHGGPWGESERFAKKTSMRKVGVDDGHEA